jgi:hypothetical protein
MTISQLISDHPDWTDAQVAEAASAPVYHDIPLSEVAAALVGYVAALREMADNPSVPTELAQGIAALLDALASPHLRVIEASAVPQMHALAAAAVQVEPQLSGIAGKLASLGVTRQTVTESDVIRTRLLAAGNVAYEQAVDALNASYNEWVGRVQRGETTEPWSE